MTTQVTRGGRRMFEDIRKQLRGNESILKKMHDVVGNRVAAHYAAHLYRQSLGQGKIVVWD